MVIHRVLADLLVEPCHGVHSYKLLLDATWSFKELLLNEVVLFVTHGVHNYYLLLDAAWLFMVYTCIICSLTRHS